MAYTRSIPQASNQISISQGQILANFENIDSGVSGTGPGFARDHVTMVAGATGGLHLQVHAAQQAALPANATPAANEGTYYVSQTDSVAGTKAQAVFKSGDTSVTSILGCIKAWGIFSNPPLKDDGFNFHTVSRTGDGKYDIAFINQLPNDKYGVLVSCSMQPIFSVGGIAGVSNLTVHGFKINVRSLSADAGTDAYPTTFIVLQT